MTWEVLPSIRKTGNYSLADHGRDQMPGLNCAHKTNLFGSMRIVRTMEEEKPQTGPQGRCRG